MENDFEIVVSKERDKKTISITEKDGKKVIKVTEGFLIREALLSEKNGKKKEGNFFTKRKESDLTDEHIFFDEIIKNVNSWDFNQNLHLFKAKESFFSEDVENHIMLPVFKKLEGQSESDLSENQIIAFCKKSIFLPTKSTFIFPCKTYMSAIGEKNCHFKVSKDENDLPFIVI